MATNAGRARLLRVWLKRAASAMGLRRGGRCRPTPELPCHQPEPLVTDPPRRAIAALVVAPARPDLARDLPLLPLETVTPYSLQRRRRHCRRPHRRTPRAERPAHLPWACRGKGAPECSTQHVAAR